MDGAAAQTLEDSRFKKRAAEEDEDSDGEDISLAGALMGPPLRTNSRWATGSGDGLKQ